MVPFWSNPFGKSSMFLDSSSSEDAVACTDIIKAIATKFEHFCLPNQEIVKKVSFSNRATVHVLPSEPSGTFWIKQKDLVQVHEEKSKIFSDRNCIEFHALDMIASVIEKSHIVYQKLYRFIVTLDGYDVYLTQTKVKVDDETTIDFPEPEIFNKLQKNKEYFNAKVNNLLNLLKPTYEINEHLFNLIKGMNQRTKIDLNLFKQFNSEAIKIHSFHETLINNVHICRMDLYRSYLSNIRRQTNNLEFGIITLDDANKQLNNDIGNFRKVSISMNKALKSAECVDFVKLHETTAKFYDLANDALAIKS